ncbi:MAG: hypothetical protein Q8930_09210, partial [Bacillota bacterium]|nr:hypothetical protein [Bacillota bacterium]
MKTVFLQCKRGLKSPALLNAFINLGVEREWLEKELQKICSSAHIETGNESSYIIIDAEEEKRLSQNKILGKLEECLFDEEIRNSIKKVLSLMANSGYNQKETRDSGTVAA